MHFIYQLTSVYLRRTRHGEELDVGTGCLPTAAASSGLQH